MQDKEMLRMMQDFIRHQESENKFLRKIVLNLTNEKLLNYNEDDTNGKI